MADGAYHRVLYERAVKEHAGELFRYAFRISGRHDVAEDLVQETFFHAWRSIHSLRNEQGLRAWLFQILRRRHFRAIARRRIARSVPLEHAAEVVDKAPARANLADREALQAALDQLDAPFKQAFLMVYLEGLTCAAAARELKIPLGTLLSRVFRAKQALRATMNANAPSAPPGTADNPNNQTKTGGQL